MSGKALIAGVAAGVLACAPAAVPVLGPQSDIGALAGEWEGRYTSDDTGRSGWITFALEAGADTASGDVVMVPLEDPDAGVPYEWERGQPPPPFSQLLSISWVSVDAGQVRGRIGPYQDPNCGCELSTTFVGMIGGDRIEGTFESRHLDCPRVDRGSWWAERKN